MKTYQSVYKVYDHTGAIATTIEDDREKAVDLAFSLKGRVTEDVFVMSLRDEGIPVADYREFPRYCPQCGVARFGPNAPHNEDCPLG